MQQRRKNLLPFAVKALKTALVVFFTKVSAADLKEVASEAG